MELSVVVSFWEQGVLPFWPTKMQNHIGNHKEKNWIVNKKTQRKQDGRNDNINLSEEIRKTKVAYFFLSAANKNRQDADKRKENPNMHSETRKQIHDIHQGHFQLPSWRQPPSQCFPRTLPLWCFSLPVRPPALSDKDTILMVFLNPNYPLRPSIQTQFWWQGIQHLQFGKTQSSPHHRTGLKGTAQSGVGSRLDPSEEPLPRKTNPSVSMQVLSESAHLQ